MTEVHSQDELSALFSRNLSFNPYVAQTPPFVEPAQNVDPPSYSISQHYNHSAHIAKAQQAARSASEPLSSTNQHTVEIILARHGVDIATLFPAQIELFKSAEPGQQMRLVELWRISPPSYGGHALSPNLCTWQTTNFEQEEAMAKMRYDRKMLEQQGHWMDQNSQTGTEPNTITLMQGRDGCWSGSDLPMTVHHEPEPYMTSGYEQLARREYEASAQQQQHQAYNPATDPVYNIIPNSGPEWEQRQQQAMENQYGAFQQNNFVGSKVVSVGYGDDMDML